MKNYTICTFVDRTNACLVVGAAELFTIAALETVHIAKCGYLFCFSCTPLNGQCQNQQPKWTCIIMMLCKHCKWSSFLTSLLTQWPWTLWYRNWVVSFITLWNLRLFLTPSLPLLELKFMIYVRSITIIMNGILLGTYEVHIMNIFPICTTLFCASGCNLGSKPREKVIKEILELFHGFLFSYEVHQTHTSTSYRNTLRNSNLDTFRLNWIACEIVALFLLSELNLAIKENCEVKRICISQESFIESKKGNQHRMAWCYFCNIQPSHTKLKLIKGRFAFFVSSFAVPWRHLNNLPNRSRLSILLVTFGDYQSQSHVPSGHSVGSFLILLSFPLLYRVLRR